MYYNIYYIHNFTVIINNINGNMYKYPLRESDKIEFNDTLEELFVE